MSAGNFRLVFERFSGLTELQISAGDGDEGAAGAGGGVFEEPFWSKTLV